MKKLDSSIKQIEKYINKETNNIPDITFRKTTFCNHNIMITFCCSLSSREVINNFILEFLEEKQLNNCDSKNILEFLENNIPVNKIEKIDNYEDFIYHLLSGNSILSIDGEKQSIVMETKSSINSDISNALNETVIKGPKDGFTENFQTNLGLIRRRLKTEKLWIDEYTVGKLSKTKVGILHVNGIASEELVKLVKEKISKIDIDAVQDSNYIIDVITGNSKKALPTFMSTERPDVVTFQLLEGKIAIVVENSQLVIIIPTIFTELFQSTEDYYQKTPNANYTRIIRFIAFLITILTPAIYIALTTYNHEAIPSKLMINFAIQRDGVPFPTIIEALLMLITFEILKETDTRIPQAIGSSLSIVGALVLGDAAVTAGIVSPIMVIVIAITSISGFILTFFDAVNGLRWWRLLFIIAASISGIMGIVIAGLIFIINLSSMESLGLPYLSPIAPTIFKDLGDTIILTNAKRFFKRKTYLTTNITKGKETK